MKTLIRPATALFTVFLALSALLAVSAPSVPSTAASHRVAGTPRMLLDVTARQKRLLAVNHALDASQQLASRRLGL